jgi:NADPH-dependent curcumin reductase CurA
MRGWVSNVGNYSEPVPLGGVMRSFAVGRVVELRSAAFAVDDIVTGLFGWQDYAVIETTQVQRKVDGLDREDMLEGTEQAPDSIAGL